MEKATHEQVSEGRVLVQTGRSTNHWIILLKRWGIKKKGHTEAAKYLQDEYELSPWWAQMIVVRCEYRLGLRVPKPFPKMPQEVRNALIAVQLLERFRALAPSHRRDYLEWIREAKKPATRDKRIRKVIHQLRFKVHTNLKKIKI